MFLRRRRAAALVLLPLAVVAATTSIAAAAGGGISTPAGGKSAARTSLHISDRHPMAGEKVRVHGRVRPDGRRPVTVFTGSGRLRTRTNKDGYFSLRWKAPRAGSYRLRAVGGGKTIAAGRSPVRTVTAFRPALASWYGPGLYGNHVACGGTLRPGTIGVANKSLPCGSKLTLRYRGRSVRVEVIDRGPFAGGREFDLTEATKNALHFPDVGTVLTSR